MPELVQGLVLVSMSPVFPGPQARAEREVFDEKLARQAEREGTEAFLASWLAQPLFAYRSRRRARLAERHALAPDTSRTAPRARCGAMRPMWDRLGELAMPSGS